MEPSILSRISIAVLLSAFLAGQASGEGSNSKELLSIPGEGCNVAQCLVCDINDSHSCSVCRYPFELTGTKQCGGTAGVNEFLPGTIPRKPQQPSSMDLNYVHPVTSVQMEPPLHEAIDDILGFGALAPAPGTAGWAGAPAASAAEAPAAVRVG